MNLSELDNPFWSALRSRHRAIALCRGEAARYPAAFAPFLGVASAQADVAGAMESLVAADESVYLLGVVPALPRSWILDAFPPLAQMICTAPIQVIDGPAVIELTEAHRADVLARSEERRVGKECRSRWWRAS